MQTAHTLTWTREELPQKLATLLQTLGSEYPIRENAQGTKLSFQKSAPTGKVITQRQPDGSFLIQYSSLQTAARGLGNALADREATEDMEFKTLGIMLDCSRNAVMTVAYLRKWLRRLALMGYNMVMLYTEDTYQMPEEPYFGYLRGAYTLEELQELDSYADKLGIELVGCIQTLGHLAQPLQWQAYPKDTNNVLLVDEPRTYQLIEHMIAFWRKALKSTRIHVGMDETHDLGRGRFMDLNGYQRGFDIFNRHLKKVTEICSNYDLKPIIWSDMYFRMGNKNLDYYDKNTVIPEDVKAQIPQDVTLCYWDYYHTDQAFYEDWIDRHRALGSEPHMGSGVWTWSSMWYNHAQTAATVVPCIAACRKKKLQEVYFTMWGDNGAYCDYDSALAGLAWAANLAWGGNGDDEQVAPAYQAICGTPYAEQILAAGMQFDLSNQQDRRMLYAPVILWDDPLLGIAWREARQLDQDVWDKALASFKTIRRKLEPAKEHKQAGDIGHACNILDVMIGKITIRKDLLKAYETKDVTRLKVIKDAMIPQLIEAIRRLDTSFRRQWLRRNKPFGLEIMQIRFAGQIARFEETARRIGELLDGTVDRIEELEVKLEKPVGWMPTAYGHYASACFI